MNRVRIVLALAASSGLAVGHASAQTPAPPAAPAASYTVTLVPPVHGTVDLVPALPADGKYPAGTVVTVKAKPAAGYAIDSIWYSVAGRFGQMYHEHMAPDFA